MKEEHRKVSLRYCAALRAHLLGGRAPGGEKGGLSALGLGSQALAAGMHTLDLAQIHEQVLVSEILPDYPKGQRSRLIKKAGAFFAVAVSPIEGTHPSAREAAQYLNQVVESLSQRTVELVAMNVELTSEIGRRRQVERDLKKSERHYSVLLEQSNRLQEQLRRLSRQILTAQEDERRVISRELHDVIAQTLTGINVRLSALKKEATTNTKGLETKIAGTQQLVERSVDIVHQFARELRPAVLDDLGLIPALHAYMESFSARTGVHTRLTAVAEVEQLVAASKTVLFRVAQEALINVGRHAKAAETVVTIVRSGEVIEMSVQDDGKAFNVARAFRSIAGHRLGLLGMRERLEMVGGKLELQSSPGKGSTIIARVPFAVAKTKKTTK